MKIMLLLTMKGGIPVGADLRAEIGEKMGKWMADIEEKGILESTYALHPANEASLFKQSGEKFVPWTPSAEEDVVVASIVVNVESTEEANFIVEMCPHLLCGDIEMRQVHGSDAEHDN